MRLRVINKETYNLLSFPDHQEKGHQVHSASWQHPTETVLEPVNERGHGTKVQL